MQQADEGVIETFTILYVTPDGFLPPLALALIRAPEGRLLMAQGEDESQLKIGQEVYLRRIDGVYLFTVKSQIQKVQDAFMKLFRRKAATPAPKDNRKEAPNDPRTRRPVAPKSVLSRSSNLFSKKLKEAIVAGKLAPGERLFEAKLAASLKVGPVLLREALRALESEGYVTFRPDNEVVVSKPTREEIEDYYAISGALEGLAARLAVERAQRKKSSLSENCTGRSKKRARSATWSTISMPITDFHRFIAEIARNERLYRLVDQLRQDIQKTRILALRSPQRARLFDARA